MFLVTPNRCWLATLAPNLCWKSYTVSALPLFRGGQLSVQRFEKESITKIWKYQGTSKVPVTDICHGRRTTGQKMRFSIKNFSSKCGQIHRKLRIWSHLLWNSLKENSIFCEVCTMFLGHAFVTEYHSRKHWNNLFWLVYDNNSNEFYWVYFFILQERVNFF